MKPENLNIPNSEEMTKLIFKAVSEQDISIVDSSITLFSSFCFKDEKEMKDFPNDVFNTIMLQMRSVNFQQMPDSSTLLSVLQYDWGRLSIPQKKVLIEAIKDSFLFFKDELSMFMLSELLGKYFANEKALVVLNTLKRKTESETARAYITYGYGSLAKYTSQSKVKKESISILRKLEKDASHLVKKESVEALNKIYREYKDA